MEIDMGIGGLEFGSSVTWFPGLVFVVVVIVFLVLILVINVAVVIVILILIICVYLYCILHSEGAIVWD